MRSTLAFSALLALTAFACSSPPPAEGTGSTRARQLAGRVVPEDELAQSLRNAGFDEDTVPKMICTAKYESSFHEEATNSNSNGTTDYGILQINSIHVGKTSGCPSSSDELLSLDANVQCAFGVFSVQGLNAWVAYKSHKSECDAATAPAGSADPNANPNADPNADPCTTNPNNPNCTQDPNQQQQQDPCMIDPNSQACKDAGGPYGDPNDPNGNGGYGDPCQYDPYYPGCYGDDPYYPYGY